VLAEYLGFKNREEFLKKLKSITSFNQRLFNKIFN
jgi:hypothetical protein